MASLASLAEAKGDHDYTYVSYYIQRFSKDFPKEFAKKLLRKIFAISNI